MSTPAFFGSISRCPPESRLHPLSPGRFAREAAGDPQLLSLLEAYETEALDSTSALPPMRSFRPERLLAFGMTARAGFLNKRCGVVPPVAIAAITRAAAGPQLHCRPARFRLVTIETSRLLVLLPFRSCEQSEVVEVLAAFGL